jgi:hypothetical protein
MYILQNYYKPTDIEENNEKSTKTGGKPCQILTGFPPKTCLVCRHYTSLLGECQLVSTALTQSADQCLQCRCDIPSYHTSQLTN